MRKSWREVVNGSQESSASSTVAAPKARTELAGIAIGPWNENEFAAILPNLSGASAWSVAKCPASAAAAIEQRQTALEVALVACPWPGFYSSCDLLQLQQAAPLLRVVLVAGTWCEGELRTGSPPDGFLRLYWYELPTWWEAATAARSCGLAPPWSSPPRDRFRGPEFAELSRNLAAQHAAVINSNDVSVFQALAAALAPFGWKAAWQPRLGAFPSLKSIGAPLGGGIFDAGQLDDAELRALRRFTEQVGDLSAPVVVLLDYPRIEHAETIKSAGAAGMLPKPYRVEAVVTMLENQTIPPAR